MTIRFGLIGCGRVAPRHAQSMQQINEARWSRWPTSSPAGPTISASEYGAAAHYDHRSLLDRQDIDAVSICVPSGLHAQVAVDALEAGKHVLVEKPIALSLDDADRMIAVARRTRADAGRGAAKPLQLAHAAGAAG